MNNKRHSEQMQQLSLDEINNTIKFDHRSSNKQKFLSFLGPGLLIVFGHDPGNWININARLRPIWLYFAIRNSYFKFISNVTSKHQQPD